MKAGGIGPSHSKRKTTCLIALQSLCPERHALRGSRLCTFSAYSFFFLFFLFFRPRGGGRVGHVEGQDPQGYVVLRRLFCCLERLPAIRIRRIAIASFPKYIAYSRHQFRVRCRYWPDYSPGAAGRYGHDLIPWILTTFRGRAGMGKVHEILIDLRTFAVARLEKTGRRAMLSAAMPEILCMVRKMDHRRPT